MDLTWQPQQSLPAPRQSTTATADADVCAPEGSAMWACLEQDWMGNQAILDQVCLADEVSEDPDLGAEVDALAEEEAEALAPETGAEEQAEAAPEAEACKAADFSGRVGCIFDQIDADGDGYLSEADIDQAMLRSDLSPEDAAAVAMLKRYRTNLEETSNDEYFDEDDGVTRADIAAYQAALADLQQNGTPIPEDLASLEGMFQNSVARVNNTNHQLVAEGGPSLDAIHQGSVGSCSFLSAVGSMIDQKRGQELVDMITPNDDGTYTVTFPGRDPVTVDAPTNAELAYQATSGQNGMWLPILEKAYGRLRDDDNVVAADGAPGALRDAIGTLSGNDVDVDDNWATDTDTTHEKLSAAIAEGRLVTASQMGGDFEGIPGGHAYTVTDYDPTTRTVTLRNPWGHGERTDANGNVIHGPNDGVFTLTLEEFDDIYTDIAYEQKR